MQYRPSGWKNPHKGYKDVIGDPDFDDKVMRIQFNAFEAGADAYEEGLKKEGEYVEDSYEPIELCDHKSGWWVFIPERKE